MQAMPSSRAHAGGSSPVGGSCAGGREAVPRMTPLLLSDIARVFRRDAEAIQRAASARPPWVMTDDERAEAFRLEDIADELMTKAIGVEG